MTAPEATHVTPVEVANLSKTYALETAVADLSFTLDPGSVTGFVGPNGAGKSTTLRMILGLTRPSGGQALVTGRPYATLDSPARRVGAVLESNDFHPRRSGRNHLRVLAAQSSLPVGRTEEVLESVGLTGSADRAVGGYSLGMRQRLGLAGALLGQPSILILDEPTNGLDPRGVHWLRGLLRDFAAGGGTVLVSSHQLAELAQSVDRVLILVGGRLLADTDVASLQDGGRSLEDAYLHLTAQEDR